MTDVAPLLVVAVPAAVLAAACFGSAGVLQHRATHETAERRPLQPGLLVDLIKLPGFRLGVVLGAIGFVLQVVALRYGPLILVQPLLVTGVLFYLLLASALGHHKPDRILLVGALVALAGLSAFLLVANPSGGHDNFSSAAALPLGLGLLGVVALSLLASTRVPKEIRSLPLAVATAVCYGVTAGLVRSIAPGGVGPQLFDSWQLYAIILVGPAGFLLNQNAYQQGRLGSVPLAIITIGDPLVAIGIGVVWLGESISPNLWSVVVEILALAVMTTGVVTLTRRAYGVAQKLQSRNQLPETSA